MALAAVVAGSRAIVTDVNQFYNLLKGVTGSGESITLIHNAASALIFQPSSDPAADTVAVAIKNNAGTQQSGLTFDGNAIFKTYLKIGTNPATVGGVRLAQSQTFGVYARNVANGADIHLISNGGLDTGVVGDPNMAGLWLQTAAGTVDFRYAVTALGGGAAPTVGTIGGSGPAAAAQNSWLKLLVNGTASYIPIWR